MPETLFELRGVSLTYRALPVLREIDWALRAGEQWAVLGPNGAGKTSLARILARQVSHIGGDFQRAETLAHRGVGYVCFEQQKTLCDRDRKLDDSETRNNAFDPGTTVAQALLGNQPATDAFQNWIERLRMEHILHRGLRFISTGEMRKTLLVKALLAEPAVLILDSPLDGLDLAAQEQMGTILADLLQSPMAVLLLCRDLQDIPPGISHVLALNEGRILRSGIAEDVLADPEVVAIMQPPLPELSALPPQSPRPYSLPEAEPLLRLRQVHVQYGDTPVLDQVDWTFERGQHCHVIGPNGCGKTTLLSLITGDNHKAYGQDIELFGRRRGSGESVWEIKEKFGQVDTALHLNHVRGMKALEVVISGFFDSIGLYDDWGERQRALAQHWLRALGLQAFERQAFDDLSFGIQRMVLLARAMVKSPAILLLDEPCLGLDAHHRTLVLRAIDHIAANSDTQIIYVSHSEGQVPACINQRLSFQPGEKNYRVTQNTVTGSTTR